MKRGENSRLDPVIGVTTAKVQGDNVKSRSRVVKAMAAHPRKGKKDQTANRVLVVNEGIHEGPNDSSYLPISQPQVRRSHWRPPDIVSLVVIAGLLIVLTLCIVVRSEHVNLVVTALATCVGYYFGMLERRRQKR